MPLPGSEFTPILVYLSIAQNNCCNFKSQIIYIILYLQEITETQKEENVDTRRSHTPEELPGEREFFEFLKIQ